MKRAALAEFLHCPESKIFRGEYGYTSYTDTNMDYLVLTEREANEEAKKHVWNFIHSFEFDFLCRYLPLKVSETRWNELMQQSCPCCQWMAVAFITDYEEFLDEAIRKYGRAYFLCFADKTEYRVALGGKEFCVYRLV